MTVITHEDMRVLKYCNKGSRDFCLRHGINWTVFVQQGIPVEEVAHIDDAMLKEVIEIARQREARALEK